jgi:hypothetical protein
VVDQLDWHAVLESPEVRRILDEGPRVVVVPPSPEVQQMMETVGSQLGGVEQLTTRENSAGVIKLNTADFAEQMHSLSRKDVIAALSLLFTILAFIFSVVVAVHDWTNQKPASPVTNQTTNNVTDNETAVNVTNLPPVPSFCARPRN